jgi:endonuclease/exonuclease/phosphatase (EEP) superfamily protein YafD
MGKRLLLSLVNVATGSVAIAALLGFLSPHWWGFSFLEHPRPQYCLILVIAVLVNGIAWRSRLGRVWAIGWLGILLINLGCVAPVLVGPPAQAATTAQPLRLLHLTLDLENLDVKRAVKFANAQSADLISLLEVSPEAVPQLEAGLTNYQLIKAEPRHNSHGSAWFVARQPRYPIQVMGSEVIHLPADSDRPLLKTTISYADKALELLCFHAIRPRSVATVAYQRVEFVALSEWSQSMLKQGKHPIAIGDYNNTPWSLSFRRLLTDSGMRNSQNGFGLQPTWHSSLPTFLQIPIDHCLYSSALVTRDRRVGADIGSDHLPIIVDLQI